MLRGWAGGGKAIKYVYILALIINQDKIERKKNLNCQHHLYFTFNPCVYISIILSWTQFVSVFVFLRSYDIRSKMFYHTNVCQEPNHSMKSA